MHPFKLFSGSSHPALAQEVCQYLGLPLSRSETKQFTNENLCVRIDDSVRGQDCVVIQTASPPLHTHMMELFILCDTLRAYGAKSICAVIPYFPYVRSDKRDVAGVGIVARLVADLVETSGATSALLLDLHSRQAQGFFRIPTFAVSAHETLVGYLRGCDLTDAVLVSADAGEVKDIVPYIASLNLPLAIIDKRRYDDTETAHVVRIVGDVVGKTAILIDDEIASGGTICSSAESLLACGAARVWALCTHPVLSGQAVERIAASPLERLIVTNSVPVPPQKVLSKLVVLSIAPVLAEAILGQFA